MDIQRESELYTIIENLDNLLDLLMKKFFLDKIDHILTSENIEEYQDYIISMKEIMPDLYAYINLIRFGAKQEKLSNGFDKMFCYVSDTYNYCLKVKEELDKKNELI